MTAKKLASGSTFVAGTAALTAIAGWLLDSEALRSLLPGRVAMNPVTAIAFLCASGSLWLQRSPDAPSRGGRILAAATLFIGGWKLIAIFAGADAGIDRFLFPQAIEADATLPNRMAPNTALAFTLLGGALTLLDSRRRVGLFQGLALASGCVAFFALLGHLYGVADLYRVAAHIPMAFNTALAMTALSLGVLAARPRVGIASVVTAPGAGGYLARRMLPAAIVLPAALGAVRLWGEDSGLYTRVTGTLLFVVAVILLMATLVWWTARALDRMDRERQSAALFFQSIFDNLPLMVFVKDAATLRFVHFNRAGEQLTGIAREEMVGKSDYDFFPAEQADFFTAADRAVLEGGEVMDIPEEPLQTAAGMRILHTRKVPLAGADGRPGFLLGISADITERKNAEARILALNRELEAFSYSVSHDLRAPLRAVVGFSQAVLDDHAAGLDDEGRGLLNRIVAAGGRMTRLIDGMLALSRLSRAQLRRGSVDLSAVAREVGADLRESPGARSVDFRVEAGLQAVGDPQLVRILLENLIGNAWKFTSRTTDPRIEVGMLAGTNGGGSTFYVRDNGAGYDAAYADKLFKPFQRLHAMAEFEGTGIGLATVQRIVQRHQGRIWAEGAVGEGATFYFTLGG